VLLNLGTLVYALTLGIPSMALTAVLCALLPCCSVFAFRQSEQPCFVFFMTLSSILASILLLVFICLVASPLALPAFAIALVVRCCCSRRGGEQPGGGAVPATGQELQASPTTPSTSRSRGALAATSDYAALPSGTPQPSLARGASSGSSGTPAPAAAPAAGSAVDTSVEVRLHF
jgi:hypothetical protein